MMSVFVPSGVGQYQPTAALFLLYKIHLTAHIAELSLYKQHKSSVSTIKMLTVEKESFQSNDADRRARLLTELQLLNLSIID